MFDKTDKFNSLINKKSLFVYNEKGFFMILIFFLCDLFQILILGNSFFSTLFTYVLL
jgi:hypothetical protein